MLSFVAGSMCSLGCWHLPLSEDLVPGGGRGFLHLPICSELSAHSSPFPFLCPSHLSTGAGSQIPSSHCWHVGAAALGCQTASLFLPTLLLSPGQGSCQDWEGMQCQHQPDAVSQLGLKWRGAWCIGQLLWTQKQWKMPYTPSAACGPQHKAPWKPVDWALFTHPCHGISNAFEWTYQSTKKLWTQKQSPPCKPTFQTRHEPGTLSRLFRNYLVHSWLCP